MQKCVLSILIRVLFIAVVILIVTTAFAWIEVKPGPQIVPVQANCTPVLTETLSPVRLTATDDAKTITLAKGQHVRVTLDNPGDGGYQFDNPQYDTSHLCLYRHIYNPPATGVPGDFGTDVWEFGALQTGATDLTITATRPWKGGDTSAVFKISILIK